MTTKASYGYEDAIRDASAEATAEAVDAATRDAGAVAWSDIGVSPDPRGWNVWRFDDEHDETRMTCLATFRDEAEAHRWARRNGGHQVQRGLDGDVTGV